MKHPIKSTEGHAYVLALPDGMDVSKCTFVAAGGLLYVIDPDTGLCCQLELICEKVAVPSNFGEST